MEKQVIMMHNKVKALECHFGRFSKYLFQISNACNLETIFIAQDYQILSPDWLVGVDSFSIPAALMEVYL